MILNFEVNEWPIGVTSNILGSLARHGPDLFANSDFDSKRS
tara:strand:+ start:236 stop:358 length:123 start_codon:yes stop_codon:yes gene_type:complete